MLFKSIINKRSKFFFHLNTKIYQENNLIKVRLSEFTQRIFLFFKSVFFGKTLLLLFSF